jgi:type I restriction enzyme S subunit
MAKDVISTATPRLRFPEFRDSPGWEMTKLSKLCHLVSGLHLAPDQYGKRGEIAYFTGPSDFTNDSDTISKWTDGSTNVGIENDVLITVKGSGVGEIWYLKLPSVAMGRQLMAIRAINASSQFIYQFLLTRRSRFEDLASGNLIPGLSRTDILGLETPYLSLAEQQKIGDCLSSLDDVIAAQRRKVETLKAHKQGLMRQLFPREGETLPYLRFPEFRHAPGWEEKKAGSLFANRGDRGEDGLPIYSVTIHDGMVKRSSFDRDFGDIQDPGGNKKACKNDIAYNMMRMWQGALGVAIEDCMVSPAYVVLAPRREAVPQFFAYLFKLPTSLRLLTSYSRGLTKDRLRLYYDDFARMTLICPSEPEQQRIADCLLSLDAEIATESEKLEALKVHKVGLMQQLFPSPEGD